MGGTFQIDSSSCRRLNVDGLPVLVVSAEDLILSKLVWAKGSASAMQLGDVRLLINSFQDLDWAYIDKWAHELDVQIALGNLKST